MRPKSRLLFLIGAAAFISGVISSVALWVLFHGQLYIDMVVGSYGSWLLLVFPFIVTALASFWALFFHAERFNGAKGALVALLTLASFCLFLNVLHGSGVSGFFSFLLATFVFFGWALMLVGAGVGWYFRRSINAAP